MGAERILAVATAAMRSASNRDELATAVQEAGGMELSILSDEEEARLVVRGRHPHAARGAATARSR